MTEKEKTILKALVEDPNGLLSPADFVGTIAQHDGRSVANLVAKKYIEEVPQDVRGVKLGTTKSVNFYRATEKGLAAFDPWYKKIWINFNFFAWLRDHWVASSGAAVIAGLILYYVFGIGKTEPSIQNNSPVIGSIQTIGQTGGDNVVINGFLAETPVGKIDGANSRFEVSNRPEYVVADGVTYFEGRGYVYSEGEIIMDIPTSEYLKAFYKK